MTDIWGLPPVVSEHGLEVDYLWKVISVLVGVVFVATEAVLLFFCWAYRQKGDAPRKAHYTHGSHKLEVVWTLVPTFILVVLALFSNNLWARIKTTPPTADEIGAEVYVVAQRFTWQIYYPGPNGVFDTPKSEMMINKVQGDDVLQERRLVLPEDKTVMVYLTSKDVIHSFFIPLARVKQDAVPGYTGRVWFKITEPSDPGADGENFTIDDKPFEIACAELCGDSHYDMYGNVYVLPEAEYKKYMDDLYSSGN